jgi:hypothetical protein
VLLRRPLMPSAKFPLLPLRGRGMGCSLAGGVALLYWSSHSSACAGVQVCVVQWKWFERECCERGGATAQGMHGVGTGGVEVH